MRALLALVSIAAFGIGAFLLFSRNDEALPRVVQEEVPPVEILVEGLEVPWDIAFLPEGGMLISERPGRVLHIDESGAQREIAIEGVMHRGEGGLLGLVLHPNFAQNRLLYLYFTAPAPGGQTNRVERYRFDETALTEKLVIIENIPGATYHDGGRIEFGPDGMLYITTGDAGISDLAQDPSSLAGKILRVRDDGILPQNPLPGAVYSLGHRNPQGLAWDEGGNLWATEHGRSGLQSGYDEINLIIPGRNYGWPESEGDTVAAGTQAPALHSGASDTWAPASLAYINGRLFFGGLRGEALYEAVLEGDEVIELREHFKNQFGRIRTVRVGPDGMLYLTTSNHDGRGDAGEGDDRIIRADPEAL